MYTAEINAQGIEGTVVTLMLLQCTRHAIIKKLGPLLLTWINFDLIMDKYQCKVQNEITNLFPNFNGATVKVWESSEWISN